MTENEINETNRAEKLAEVADFMKEMEATPHQLALWVAANYEKFGYSEADLTYHMIELLGRMWTETPVGPTETYYYTLRDDDTDQVLCRVQRSELRTLEAAVEAVRQTVAATTGQPATHEGMGMYKSAGRWFSADFSKSVNGTPAGKVFAP